MQPAAWVTSPEPASLSRRSRAAKLATVVSERFFADHSCRSSFQPLDECGRRLIADDGNSRDPFVPQQRRGRRSRLFKCRIALPGARQVGCRAPPHADDQSEHASTVTTCDRHGLNTCGHPDRRCCGRLGGSHIHVLHTYLHQGSVRIWRTERCRRRGHQGLWFQSVVVHFNGTLCGFRRPPFAARSCSRHPSTW